MKIFKNEQGGSIVGLLLLIAVIIFGVTAYQNGFFTDEKKRQALLDDTSNAISEVIDNVQDGGLEVICVDGFKCLVDEGKTYRLATKGTFGILRSVKCDKP